MAYGNVISSNIGLRAAGQPRPGVSYRRTQGSCAAHSPLLGAEFLLVLIYLPYSDPDEGLVTAVASGPNPHGYRHCRRQKPSGAMTPDATPGRCHPSERPANGEAAQTAEA